MRIISSPEKFVDWFNKMVPAYRPINTNDLKKWEELSLIRRYGYFYTHDDVKTTIGILTWEQEIIENNKVDRDTERLCKGCGRPMQEEPKKRGRPKEYCRYCEPFRGAERYRKWHKKQKTTSSCD